MKLNYVAGNDGLRGNHRFLSIADDTGLKRDGFGKFLSGMIGSVLLNEIEENAGENNGVDNDEAGRVAADGGKDAGDEKNQDERVSEVREKFKNDGMALLVADDVGAVLPKPGGGLRAG
jgi:hypothetical protein